MCPVQSVKDVSGSDRLLNLINVKGGGGAGNRTTLESY